MGKKLGNLIKAARTDAGLTQEQLARKVKGVTAADIGRYERGEAEPTQQVVKDIAKACGVTQKSLLDAMPKTSTSRTSTSSSTASKSSMSVTATERRLVELYRAADAETKKQVLTILRGNEGNEIIPGVDLSDGIGLDDLMGVAGYLFGDKK
ncbi:MAG: helix-turn-helix transcriptional regulator [Eggerthellaceae bacterium]|nr:helix-turn-helix transcriptional regulator [Eggerthellaceae bacterium]